ncbi:S-adenosyl-L-methionine-dependent methyltransferase [Xylaria nigripes]|nr:S-adenosyl-L-methionine-dependent methyltransferase [Xylaria nigripes]
MEKQLFQTLRVSRSSRVLDAGCGNARVTRYMAKATARKLGREKGAEGSLNVRLMDYHHLDAFGDACFDGVYTMETLVHATDPERVLGGFFRVIKPSGRLAIHEYDNHAMRQVNEWSAMPTNAISSPGAFKHMLEKVGFVRDLSDHIRPMTRFFFVLTIVPFWIISFLRLQRYFVNIVAGVGAYRGYGFWRCVQIEARKPGVEKG